MAKITEIVDDGQPASIQGEQQQAASATLWASDEEVMEYVQSVADAVLACRQRGRHFFLSIQDTGMVFVRVTATGLLVRRAGCESCGCVVRVELWDVRHKRDVVTRAELVDSFLDYTDSSYLGKPGHGRMKPKQIRNAVATLALQGQSFKDVLRAATEASKK